MAEERQGNRTRMADQALWVRAGDATLCALGRIWDFVDRRQIIRRGAFIWMLALTTQVVLWTTAFASASARPGLEVAAIIAAIWAPLTALQGALFKFYDQAQRYRNGSEEKPQPGEPPA